MANDAINYVRRGGTLMIYGVYQNDALVHWPPSKIFLNEIRVSVRPGQRPTVMTLRQYPDELSIGCGIVCTDALFPACRRVPGQWEDQGKGDGECASCAAYALAHAVNAHLSFQNPCPLVQTYGYPGA